MPRITKAEWQLIWEAMNHAIDERQSFAEAYLPQYGKPTEEALKVIRRCDRFVERADAFCQKHFGHKSATTQMTAEYAAMPTISIFDIRKQKEQQP